MERHLIKVIILFWVLFVVRSETEENTAENDLDTPVPSVFSTDKLPDDLRFMPTLGNGHLSFTVFGNSIYLNGLYNGKSGLSHRARIPNFANITSAPTDAMPFKTTYSLNVKTGIFKITKENEEFRILHYIFTHRFYNRAIINQILVHRLQAKGALRINIRHQPGQRTEDIDFSEPTTLTKSPDSEDGQSHAGGDNEETIHLIQGYTRELEDDSYQKARKHVCCLWNHVPEEITLHEDQRSASYRFVMTADELCGAAKQEMTGVLRQPTKKLFKLHWGQWINFWESFSIAAEGNSRLDAAIQGSLFYLASALPSLKTNQPNNQFFGLSPTGLGRGGNDLLDYQGHNFWDTEIWMLPAVTQMDPRWTRQLLGYRFRMLDTARDRAKEAGFKGSRFPWESAFTGTEVTNPCCPLVAKQQFHVTADIALALRLYFAVTFDLDWLLTEGCPLAENIAEFWASRVELDHSTGLYDIKCKNLAQPLPKPLHLKDVMGPDEDHPNVTNNVFTNAVVRQALKFGEFSQSICRKSELDVGRWADIASKLKILYDEELDYHPQYEGYQPGEVIKQADVVLLGYPLLYPMNHSTRENDLRIYESATRESGPAMTWAMHAINHLDTGNVQKANELFERGYGSYVRAPFQVWSEVSKGQGAVNFLTGAGGFLQSLINGYAGVRFYLNRMEIHQPRVPSNLRKFTISGIKYLGSIFDITVKRSEANLHCKFINIDWPLVLNVRGRQQAIFANTTYILTDLTIVHPKKSISREN